MNRPPVTHPRDAAPRSSRPLGVTRRVLGAIAVIVAASGLAAIVAPAGASQLTDKQAEAKQVADKLAALQSRAMDLSAQYEAANYQLHLAEQRVADAKALAARTQAEADQRRDDLKRYAVAAYQTGNDSPEIDALLTSDAVSGVQKRSYLADISGSRQDLLDALSAAKQAAEEDAVRLKDAETDAASYAAQIESSKRAADSAASEQQALNQKVQGELKTLVDAENARRAAEAAARSAAARAAASTNSSAGGLSAAPPPAPGAGAAGAIRAAMSRIGAPYVWAASGPNAFDCSGFTQWAYGQVGVSLPHYSGAQYQMTVRISQGQLQPGDLVFWGGGGSEHVALYIGGGQIVHAFGAQRGVAVTALDGWWKSPSGFGRLA